MDFENDNSIIFLAHQMPVRTKETFNQIWREITSTTGTHIRVTEYGTGAPIILNLHQIEKVEPMTPRSPT